MLRNTRLQLLTVLERESETAMVIRVSRCVEMREKEYENGNFPHRL